MKNSSQFTVHSSPTKRLTSLLKKRLPTKIFNLIGKIGKAEEECGWSVYLVGGCVRDLLLGVENLDLDIVVAGDAITLVGLLKKELKASVLTHPRFGTATITLPDGFKIDFASARREKYAYPAALPDVSFSSIEEDLFRRDFTINTLAVKINQDNFGELMDLFGGVSDLRHKKIRILHKNSFIDDPTRIFRAIRFEQRYNFTIEPRTIKLIHQAKTSDVLSKLSRFRLGHDFILLLKEKKPLAAIVRFNQLSGLGIIHPKIKLNKGQLKRAASYRAADNWLHYFAVLTKELTQQELKELCCDFSLTKRNKRKLKILREEAAVVK